MTDTFWGLLIPFLGTSLGAACVFFMQGKMNRGVERSHGICLRGHGGGFDLEPFDPCTG